MVHWAEGAVSLRGERVLVGNDVNLTLGRGQGTVECTRNYWGILNEFDYCICPRPPPRLPSRLLLRFCVVAISIS